MTGQGEGNVAVTPITSEPSSGMSSEARIDILEQMSKLRVVQQQSGCEGTVVDHLKSLLEQEETHYSPCMDYLQAIAASVPSSSSLPLSMFSASSTSSLGSGSLSSIDVPTSQSTAPFVRDRVNEAWRRKLCEWCFEVADHFGMEREVVSVAMNYLDRMVAKTMEAQTGEYHLAKRQFQLVAVSSLYIAVKLHGETEKLDMDRRQILHVDVFVQLSRGFFKSETIEAMERKILFSLDWHLNPPTPLKFIASLMRLIPDWTASGYTGDGEECQPFKTVYKAIFDIAMYLTELSVCVSTFTFHSKNSIVAYASILCAMEALEDTLPLPYDARVRFVNRASEATGMLPEAEKIRCARNLLCELCPFIKERDVASLIMMGEQDILVEEDDAGKSSPICVSRVVPEDIVDAAHNEAPFNSSLVKLLDYCSNPI